MLPIFDPSRSQDSIMVIGLCCLSSLFWIPTIYLFLRHQLREREYRQESKKVSQRVDIIKANDRKWDKILKSVSEDQLKILKVTLGYMSFDYGSHFASWYDSCKEFSGELNERDWVIWLTSLTDERRDEIVSSLSSGPSQDYDGDDSGDNGPEDMYEQWDETDYRREHRTTWYGDMVEGTIKSAFGWDDDDDD